MALNREQCRVRVEVYAQTAKEPALSVEEIDVALDSARRLDAAGRLVSDLAWIETYDANAAIAAAWDVKAGKAADQHDFSAEGQQFVRSQLAKHCEAQARKYRNRQSGSVAIGGQLSAVEV